MTWNDLLDLVNAIPEEFRDNPARFCDENVFDEEKESVEYLSDDEKDEYVDINGIEIDNMSSFFSTHGKIYVLTP